MATKDPAPGPGPASSSVSQLIGDQTLNGIPVPDVIKSIMTGLHDGAQSAAHDDTTGPVPSGGTLEEPIHLQSWPVNDGQIPDTGPDTNDMLDQPPRIHNITFASEGDDLEEARQSAAAVGEDDSGWAPHYSKHASMWIAVLIIGVLSLIVIPGLVLGIVTRQVQWAIALSGAIATMVGVFAGLYYHKNRG